MNRVFKADLWRMHWRRSSIQSNAGVRIWLAILIPGKDGRSACSSRAARGVRWANETEHSILVVLTLEYMWHSSVALYEA